MKRLFSTLIVLAACVSLWSFMSYRGDSAISVKTSPVERGSISTYLTVPGVVKAARRVDVISRIPGHLISVLVNEGEHVAKGQLLAQLDDAEARAQVLRTKAIMERSKEKIKELKRKLRRVREVKLTGGESLQAVENVEAELSDAQSELKVNQADYQLQNIKLDLHRVLAPFAGVVVHRNAEVGQAVQPALGEATTLFTVVDDSVPYIEAQVDAGDSGLISQSSLVQVMTDAWPDIIWDENVVYIARAVNKQDTDGTNTLSVKISLSRYAQELLIGQQVDLKIRTAHRDNAIKLKHRLIIEKESGPHVATVENNRISLQPVTMGIQSITHTEVVSGLSINDQIVMPEGRHLADGDRVLLEQ
ncbi:MAG: efflux RND transporter periplasmic adaptor subunit [Candidatus Thiodiazotropha sp.]